ncbi:MAG: hypothetical protein QOJ72_2264 [Nocardioidaceae bacterium]|jgi:hypothetical protein|nr:hypothetical protein [Nocardioidaceae bacterium]
MTSSDRIDAYLDELLTRLRGPADVIRSTLAEAEAHLRDAADAETARGLSPDEAQLKAIADFGSAREVSMVANRDVAALSAAQLTAALAGAGARMVAVGLGAVAVAAVAARALATVTSTHFVFGAPAGARFSAAQCRHFLDLHPSASRCTAAAGLENANDATFLHLAVAVVGLLAIGLVLLLARRLGPPAGAVRTPVPTGIVPAIGATVFGTVGVALIAAGLSNAFVAGLWGRGLWYVEGVVALVVATGYAVGFGRALLTPAA